MSIPIFIPMYNPCLSPPGISPQYIPGVYPRCVSQVSLPCCLSPGAATIGLHSGIHMVQGVALSSEAYPVGMHCTHGHALPCCLSPCLSTGCHIWPMLTWLCIFTLPYPGNDRGEAVARPCEIPNHWCTAYTCIHGTLGCHCTPNRGVLRGIMCNMG